MYVCKTSAAYQWTAFVWTRLPTKMWFLHFADKVEKVNINLEAKTVTVTSNLSSDELLAQLRKSGKTVSYVGVKKWDEFMSKFQKYGKLKLEV